MHDLFMSLYVSMTTSGWIVKLELVTTVQVLSIVKEINLLHFVSRLGEQVIGKLLYPEMVLTAPAMLDNLRFIFSIVTYKGSVI